jgi:hypothetical protein
MEEDKREGRLISFHKPRIWLMCTVCGKRFSEIGAQARKRFARKNQDQCCSNPCRTLYAKGKYTAANQIAALEHNTAAKARMEKEREAKEKHI